tara:strand:- start:4216 stop:4449 length:234 start_codon:yes stop_codon:yes gene_type:complete
MKKKTKLFLWIFFFLNLSFFAFSTYRNESCGYDCGIIPSEAGGSGIAVIGVWGLSFFLMVVTIIVYLNMFPINIFRK